MGAVQVRRVQCRAPRSARVVDCRADVHISKAISPRGPYADQCGCMSVPAELPALILRPLALAGGYDDKEIARNRRSGLWSPVRRGAYVGSASAEGLTRRARHRLLIQATSTKLRRPAVVSHVSAAVLHGLPLWSGQRCRCGGRHNSHEDCPRSRPADRFHTCRDRRRRGAAPRTDLPGVPVDFARKHARVAGQPQCRAGGQFRRRSQRECRREPQSGAAC